MPRIMSTLRTRALRERREVGIAFRPHIDITWEDMALLVREGYLASEDVRDRKKVEAAAQKLWEHIVRYSVACAT